MTTNTEVVLPLLCDVRNVPRVKETLSIEAMQVAIQRVEDGDRLGGDMWRDMADWLWSAPVYWGTVDYAQAFRALVDEAPDLPAPNFYTEDAGGDMEGVPRFLLIDQSEHVITFSREGRDARMLGIMRWADEDMLDGYWILVAFTNGNLGWIGTGETEEQVQVCRLAFWILDNPDLMEKTVVDTAPRQSKAARRRGKPHEPSPVTVVDLRAAHREAAAEVATAERTYRSRWIVRGHWHRFWTGKAGERRLEPRYVMPYVKGPAGAPLNVTTLVKKW